MTTKEELEQRHQKAIENLKKVSQPKIQKYNTMPCAYTVAANLGVSYQTVINYISGSAKDGFLTEAMAKEFKNLKLD